MVKRKGTKGQSPIYKTLHTKLKIEQCEPYKHREKTYKYTKGVIRIRKLKDRKHNIQQKKKKNEKQMSPKQYTEN